MNSGLMTVQQNNPEKFIDYPENFHPYHIWLLIENKGNDIQTSPTQVKNTQLDVG